MPETDDPLGSEPEPDWATKLTFSIAGEVRRHRARLGMSAQQLSDKCAELGMPIQRSVLSNLESNRRTTITIAEILVLAAALQVPPGVLIFPAGYFNYAEVTPGRSVPAQAAVGWLAGTIRFGNEDPAFYHSHPFFKVRRHDEYAQQLDAYLEETVEAQRGYVEAALRIKEIDMARSALIDKHDNLTRGAILEAGIGQREYSSYQEYASPHYDQPSDEAPYPYYGAVE